MAKILTVSIGGRITKVCVVKKSGSSVKILSSFNFPTPDDTVADGLITNPLSFAKELTAQMNQNNISGVKNVQFVLNSAKIVSREISMPPVKENKLKALIMSNLSDYFPIDLDGYNITYNILEKTDGEKPAWRVMVTAAPKNLLDTYNEMAGYAKLNVKSFDHSANSQYQLYKQIPSEQIVMYVSISARQTQTTFMSKGKLLFQRQAPFGGEDLVNTAMSAADFDSTRFSEALEMMSEEYWIQSYVKKEEFDENVYRIINSITRSVDFFKSANKGADIGQIVLLDSCADIFGLREAIQSGLDTEVIKFSDIPDINKVIFGDKISFYAICASGAIAPLDLIAGETQQTGKKVKTSNTSSDSLFIPIVICAICIIGGAALSGYSFYDYTVKQNELEEIQSEIESLAYVKEVYDAFIIYDNMRGELELISEIAVNKNAGLGAFFDEMEAKMPSNLLALSASCDNFGVMMNIETATMEEAALAISQFRTFSSIESLAVSSVSESENSIGQTVATFSISCLYDLPEEEQTDDGGESSDNSEVSN